MDIYDDLDNFNEANNLQQLDAENKVLKAKVQRYEATLERLNKDFEKLNNDHKELLRNFSSLMKTAKEEITRKTEMITHINKEKDQLFLRIISNSNVAASDINKFKCPVCNCRKNVPANSKVKSSDTVDFTKKDTDQLKDRIEPEPHQRNTIQKDSPRENPRSIPQINSSESNSNPDGKNKENESKPSKISNRRKSMPASVVVSKNNKPLFSSDEEGEINDEKRRDYRDKPSRPPSAEGRYQREQEYSRTRHGRPHHFEDPRDKRIHTYGRYQRSKGPERDSSDDRIHRSGHRSRVVESPPRDRFYRTKSRDRRSYCHKNREMEEHRILRHHHDEPEYMGKRKLDDIAEEPLNKRRRRDSNDIRSRAEEESVVEHERASIVSLEHLLPMTCQSPDDVFAEKTAVQPIKEIMHTATIALEDPRLSSERYRLKVIGKDNRKYLEAIRGKNVELDVLGPWKEKQSMKQSEFNSKQVEELHSTSQSKSTLGTDRGIHEKLEVPIPSNEKSIEQSKYTEKQIQEIHSTINKDQKQSEADKGKRVKECLPREKQNVKACDFSEKQVEEIYSTVHESDLNVSMESGEIEDDDISDNLLFGHAEKTKHKSNRETICKNLTEDKAFDIKTIAGEDKATVAHRSLKDFVIPKKSKEVEIENQIHQEHHSNISDNLLFGHAEKTKHKSNRESICKNLTEDKASDTKTIPREDKGTVGHRSLKDFVIPKKSKEVEIENQIHQEHPSNQDRDNPLEVISMHLNSNQELNSKGKQNIKQDKQIEQNNITTDPKIIATDTNKIIEKPPVNETKSLHVNDTKDQIDFRNRCIVEGDLQMSDEDILNTKTNTKTKKEKHKSKKKNRKDLSNDDSEKTSRSSKYCVNNETAKEAKGVKSKEIRNKFSDLFGDSCSLITPEDLDFVPMQDKGLSVIIPQEETALDYDQVILKPNISEKEENLKSEKRHSKDNKTNEFKEKKIRKSKDSVQLSKIDSEVKITKPKVIDAGNEAGIHATVSVIPESSKPDQQASDIVQTVIISSGRQPSVEADSNLNESITVHKKLPENSTRRISIFDTPVKVVDTSTPERERKKIIVENGNDSSQASLADKNDSSVQDNSLTPNHNEVHDVKIVLKRTKKRVIKK